MKQCLIFCLFFCLFSCRNTTVVEHESITVLNFDTTNQNLLTNAIMKKTYVLLQDTVKESRFGGIDKIIVKNEVIYILDYKSTRSLYTFKMNGEFLGRIGRIGRGPGEYPAWLMDFAIDNEGNVLLVDNSKRELHKYTSNGKYVKSTSLPFIVNGLVVLENLDYLVALSYPYEEKTPQPQVIICDSLFNIKEKFLAFFEIGDKLDVSPLLKVENNIMYHREVNDTIYVFSAIDGQLIKGYALNFGSLSVPDKLWHNYSRLGEDKIYRYMYNTPLLLGKYLIGDIVDTEQKALLCIDIESSESCVIPFVYGSLDLDIPTVPLTVINESTLISYFDYEMFMGAKNIENVDENLIYHLENGGVVLCFFTFNNVY